MTQAAPACPECGREPMLRRTASQGARRGKELWRCSDLGCRGIINIEPGDNEVPAPVAGESAQARFERVRASEAERLRYAIPVLAAVGVLSAAGVFFGAMPLVGPALAAGAAVGVTGATMYLVTRLPTDVVSWQRGAEAERRVGAKLDELEGAGFVTLYDRRFPGRGGNIDAVCVGPPGVFVVETKFRSKGVEIVNGRLEVGGWEQKELIGQAVDEALRVQISIAPEMNRHRMTVVPVLCFVNRKVAGGIRSFGVLIADERSIASRLASQPPLLAAEEVQEIARQLDRALPRNER